MAIFVNEYYYNHSEYNYWIWISLTGWWPLLYCNFWTCLPRDHAHRSRIGRSVFFILVCSIGAHKTSIKSLLHREQEDVKLKNAVVERKPERGVNRRSTTVAINVWHPCSPSGNAIHLRVNSWSILLSNPPQHGTLSILKSHLTFTPDIKWRTSR